MTLEGVDYSRTGTSNWDQLARAIANAGNSFVGRYAVNDKSPTGRGIGAAEYAAMKRAGLAVFVYWEGHESWMLDGEAAGRLAAQNAQANIVGAGMPADMVVYFAHDIDPEPQHFDAIDACLRGAASVIGWDRIGVYGGWLLMDYMAGGGTVKYLCQTKAWEYGRGLHPAACLYQFAFQTNLAGTAMDDVRSYRDDYGQDTAPVIIDPPKPPKPPSIYPKGMTLQLAKRLYGSLKVAWEEKPFVFDPNSVEGKEWLKRGKASMSGTTYDTGEWPSIKDAIRRGDGTTVLTYSDGSTTPIK